MHWWGDYRTQRRHKAIRLPSGASLRHGKVGIIADTGGLDSKRLSCPSPSAPPLSIINLPNPLEPKPWLIIPNTVRSRDCAYKQTQCASAVDLFASFSCNLASIAESLPRLYASSVAIRRGGCRLWNQHHEHSLAWRHSSNVHSSCNRWNCCTPCIQTCHYCWLHHQIWCLSVNRSLHRQICPAQGHTDLAGTNAMANWKELHIQHMRMQQSSPVRQVWNFTQINHATFNRSRCTACMPCQQQDHRKGQLT